MTELTSDLIRRLREDDTPEVRREAAASLTAEFGRSDLEPGEQRLAEAIFRIMVRDADQGVRRALAEGLKNNPNVPTEIAMTLARDVAEVAVPMLHYSTVFTDDELIQIVRSQPEAWQQAVARRERVAAPVSDALVDTGSEPVVVILVENRGAVISDITSAKVIDRFADSEAVMSGLIRRPNFPLLLAERLIAAVSNQIRRRLSELTDLPAALADQLVSRGQEAMTLDMDFSDGDMDEAATDLVQLIQQMDIRGRLTATIIARALCTGHFGFFEAAAAHRAGMDRQNVHELISNSDAAALCEAAKLPDAMAEVAVMAGNIRATLADPDSAKGRTAFQSMLIEACRPRYPNVPAGDSEALIAELSPAVARRN
ncbi:MAG: DUF2336 domain-containing protein [Rhodospirillaceae bacterium]|nr:DUF2336 domain-containing protein [Rhodospirillaceae bacterium]